MFKQLIYFYIKKNTHILLILYIPLATSLPFTFHFLPKIWKEYSVLTFYCLIPSHTSIQAKGFLVTTQLKLLSLSLLILFLISLNSSSMCLVKNLMLLILFCDKISFCKLLLSFDPMKILSSIFISSFLASPSSVSFFDSSFASFHVGVPRDLSLALCSSHLHCLGAI